MTTHWLLWDDHEPLAVTIVWTPELADMARELGRKIDGPYTLAAEGMSSALMAKAVAEASRRIGLRSR
jgi:hypothetical protein